MLWSGDKVVVIIHHHGHQLAFFTLEVAHPPTMQAIAAGILGIPGFGYLPVLERHQGRASLAVGR